MDRIGRYELGPLLGRGGMALVHRARDTRLGRDVAVKLLAPELAHDPVVRRRFLTEARAAAALNHPGIVIVHDQDEIDHFGDMVAYLVMELIDGHTLAQLLAGRGSLPLEEVLPIGRAVLAALDHAHRHGVVHRDVKPANVMVRVDGGLKVTDFGIARITGSDSSRLTATGSVLGTVAYMPPEVIQGGEAGPAGDVYAVGCLLYELLTGRVPYPAANSPAMMYRHIHSAVPLVSAEVPELPSEVDDLLARAMAKPVADRYPDAGAMLAALLAVRSARPQVHASGAIGRAETTADELPPPATTSGDGSGQPATTGGAGPTDPPSRPPVPTDGPTPERPEESDETPPGSGGVFPLPVREAMKAARVVSVLLAVALIVGLGLTFGPMVFDHDTAKDRTPAGKNSGSTQVPGPTGTGPTSTGTQPGTIPPSDLPDASRRLLERGFLNVGIASNSTDLLSEGGVTGAYSGFDIEIAKVVAAHLGFGPDRIRFQSIPAQDRLRAIQQQVIDYYVGTLTITDQRKQVIAFAGPYLVSGQGVLVRTDDRVLTGFDSSLADRQVCSVTGTTTLAKLQHDIPKAIAVSRDNYGACVQDLLSGHVDAVTTDQVLLQGYVANNPGRLRLVGPAVTAERYGIGVAIDNPPLRRAIDEALRSAFTNGVWKDAYERTLGRTGIPAPAAPVLEIS
ncbi:protein kinase [Embleya sp. NPDC020886]|uniref:protein kinase domain-containing protein n=1 Tax=Embleya sp. NPDC020886 TaxID=3363980 RepID=UPI003788DC07